MSGTRLSYKRGGPDVIARAGKKSSKRGPPVKSNPVAAGGDDPRDPGRRRRVADMSGARRRALLAILVIHRNKFVPVERPIDIFLERDVSAAGERAEHAAVARLRGAQGGDRPACTRRHA
jgi:hypothetical protein